ncbi:hypothetical protein KIN20_028358 [Parelaphostrongylus tenuis]|uniref:Mos1 transposase HTH domain-containing protein n=1 Tax=Parelaphostrongylus tenuis TaxID=148309 RepID=A0AAD5WEZ7_PARTN|nr:hypothetical protein KIN20_028358 [Parelaphostrongylus tenuis]
MTAYKIEIRVLIRHLWYRQPAKRDAAKEIFDAEDEGTVSHVIVAKWYKRLGVVISVSHARCTIMTMLNLTRCWPAMFILPTTDDTVVLCGVIEKRARLAIGVESEGSTNKFSGVELTNEIRSQGKGAEEMLMRRNEFEFYGACGTVA